MNTFDVHGIPYPQGSKRAFVAKGRAIMVESAGGNHASWRNAVAQAARGICPETPLDGPLALTIVFRFPMPRSRPKSIRERGWAHKTTAPDVDKLVRTIGDALQAAGLVADDARFCNVHASKAEVVGWSGATITIRQADE